MVLIKLVTCFLPSSSATSIPVATSMVTRHLQILSGMERFGYVIVYWILITKIVAILKKKVQKIATGGFKKL